MTSPRSRFTHLPAFVIDLPYPEGQDRNSVQQVAEIAAEAEGAGDVPVRAFDSAVGRGASGTAIGVLVELGVGVGANVITSGVVAVWKRLRHRKPIMSVGALRYLCMADLVQRLSLKSVDNVVTVVACDTSGPRPSELNDVDIEPVLVVFTDQANTRSWVYLVSSRGHLLSFHEGEPITGGLTFRTDIPPPAAEPPLLVPDDDAALAPWYRGPESIDSAHNAAREQ